MNNIEEEDIDYKNISTYDCFYFDNNIETNIDNTIILKSQEKLNNIIFCVDYIINNKSSDNNNEIKNIIDLYNKFNNNSKINNSKFNNNSKINNSKFNNNSKINILDTYYNYINDNAKFIEKYKNNSIEYLNLLKETECGVKYLNKENSEFKKGGDSLNYQNQIYIDTLYSFCSQSGTFDINITISDLMANIRSKAFSNKESLITFINNNINELNYNFTINYEDYYINRYNINKKSNILTFSRQCQYRKYNEDIILSYEILQKTYETNLQLYIQQQNSYLDTLTLAEKNILKDYTRPKTFNFLNEYISNPTRGFKQRYLTKWSLTNITKNFGNSFCDIICAYIPGYDHIKNKDYREDADQLYDTITEEQWHIILQCYLTELNRIILGAPVTTTPLLFFRGSTSDYIVHNQNYTDVSGNVINVFLTNSRPSSVSFNFDSSLFFYKQGYGDKTMYRILVAPGCKLLFVTPLAHDTLKHEMEFLLPLHHVFTSYDLFTKINAYNNFKNKNNICLNNSDILNSKDIVLLPI
jgi:hypothetical protein